MSANPTYDDYLKLGYTPAQMQQWYSSYYGSAYPAMVPQAQTSAAVPAVQAPSQPISTASSKKPAGGKQRTELSKKHRQSSTNPLAAPSGPLRSAGGEVWQDPTLAEWDPNDFRLFVGNLGKEVSDSDLRQAFQPKYPSFQKARVIRDHKTHRTKGYGFVSFKEGEDFLKAFKEMQGKLIGSMPVKLQKSNWKDRNVTATFAKKVEKHGFLELAKKEFETTYKKK